MEETWKPIPGFEGRYEVSDKGNVRSLIRGKGLLRPGLSSNGYLTVALRSPGIPTRSYLVQELVLLAFVGPRPNGLIIRHLDGTRLNNCLNNLEYATFRENNLDRSRHGSNRLKPNHIADIRASLARGEKQSGIGRRYGITQAMVSHIKLRKQYAHV